MLSGMSIYRLEDAPELDTPVLVAALEGWVDAGAAGTTAAAQLAEGGSLVASFDTDAIYDYRARRPPMTFAEDHYEAYDAPRLVVRLGYDTAGTPYLLMHGPEPDVQWEGFARAVRRVVEHLGVRLSIGMGAVPMAVPHTRPVLLTNHASAQRLLVYENVWKGRIRIPSSAQSLLELRLGEWGHDAMGFVAHIPHYVAQFDYPLAGARLLEAVGDVAGLQWHLETLRAAGEEKLAEISSQIEDSDEVREVVRGLEQQYDAFTYASDLTLLGSSLIPHGKFIFEDDVQAASLDHTIWFHRPFRADEWWLYDQVFPSASNARGLVLGRVFTEDGTLVASVAQEGLIRPSG